MENFISLKPLVISSWIKIGRMPSAATDHEMSIKMIAFMMIKL